MKTVLAKMKRRGTGYRSPIRRAWPPAALVRLSAALLVALGGAVLAQEAPITDLADERLTSGERFDALIERIKAQQENLQSLEARFVQTKKSKLLLEPEVSRGTFAYKAPDLARWEFTEPNQTVIVIRNGEMLTWYRDLESAERLAIGKHTAQIEQYLAATNSVERLRRYFDFTAAFPTDGRPYRIELTPRFSRVAKRLSGMTIWFDRDRFVPVQLTYEEPDGDLTEFVFEEVRVNLELSNDRFELDLPQGVEVQTIAVAGR